MKFHIEKKCRDILLQINKNPHIREYVDHSYPPPRVYQGRGEIKLIVVKQFPTVKNPDGQASISVTLDLDKDSALRIYLTQICGGLGIKLEQNVYMTSLLKNLFVRPPTEFDDNNVIETFAGYWLPLLKDEVRQYPLAPIIALGEPTLKPILYFNQDYEVKYYWGYNDEWRQGKRNCFRFAHPDNNRLGRMIFPFPDQPGPATEFYRTLLPEYIAYARAALNWATQISNQKAKRCSSSKF